jgi:hypothetical protein
MTDSRKPTGKHLKKDAGLKVAEVLTAALGDLKESLGEKKFLRNIKKASKAMIAGLSDKKEPAKPKKKAAAKKAVAKKATAPKADTTPKADTPKVPKAPKSATKKSATKKAAAKKA